MSSEAFVKEADAERGRFVINAQRLYESAIQTLRTIPNVERPALKVDKRIDELHKLMNEAGRRLRSQMEPISSGEMDITDLVEDARSAVSGKSLSDALKFFANFCQGIDVSKMQEFAINSKERRFLSSMFGENRIASDGRVTAKTNGIGFDETLDSDDPRIQASIIQNHNRYLQLIVNAYILPALDVLHSEHKMQEADFLNIVQQSLIVPPDRKVIFSKGLFSGYNYDYITALHLLVPQVENLVRYHLKKEGAKTSTLDNRGIETENGLNTLVELSEMKAVFGDDITFEIKALFCDPFGANLRNKLAHGLITDNAYNSNQSIYAWWFILKLVCNGSLNIARQEEPTQPKETPTS